LYMREYNKLGKHRGAVLVAIIILMTTAVCCGSIVLTVANRIFESHTWQRNLLRCENITAQSLAVAERWFRLAVKSGELLHTSDFELYAMPKDDPWIRLPDSLLAELKILNNDVAIDIYIVDQNYSFRLKNTAELIDIPMCGPSEIYVKTEGASPDKYLARRFLISSSVVSDPVSNKVYSVSKNMLVLKDSGDNYHVIPLYSKKQ